MFDLFKGRPKDVKEIRNNILQFIKEKLQRFEGGEGKNITGLYLFVNSPEAEKHIYESALYFDTPDKFKSEEVQRIVDDYAISLPAGSRFEISFVNEFPKDSFKSDDAHVALFISSKKAGVTHKKGQAYIKVLNGHAEKETYLIESSAGKINIGREAKVQTADGFFRKNNIAFVAGENLEANRSVSRQHAHIEWEPESGSFFIFADEGGVPPNNKVKVRSVGGLPIKMHATEIGHRLQEGDQVILGESVVLEFTYSGD